MRHCLVFLAACLLWAAPQPRQRGSAGSWRLQYFYDRDGSSLEILDLKFPSRLHGAALGTIHRGQKPKPVALLTSDGGKTWNVINIGPQGYSLFFLNDSTGWMVAKDGLWKTENFCQTWRRLVKLPGLEDVYFSDEKHGWIAGAKKSVLETQDGGSHWRVVPAASQPMSNPLATTYGWIRFRTPNEGMIGGWTSSERERRELPAWMEPEKSAREREETFLRLQTEDGGRNWTPATVSMLGFIAQASLSPDGRGLGVVEFRHASEYPSEVLKLGFGDAKDSRAFRAKDRLITSTAIVPHGRAYLAGIEPVGNLGLQSPVPGKVKILQSANLEEWNEMDVDYRAVARRVTLAIAGEDVWAATDTGMILRLARDAAGK
jgi:hypothetical protein